jgi:hypothetical protein
MLKDISDKLERFTHYGNHESKKPALLCKSLYVCDY